jgi:hypothetical protein
LLVAQFFDWKTLVEHSRCEEWLCFLDGALGSLNQKGVSIPNQTRIRALSPKDSIHIDRKGPIL